MLYIIDVNTFYPRPEFSFNFGILSQGANFLPTRIMSVIHQHKQGSDHRTAWIGYRKENARSNYEWVDGTVSDFTNWMINAPSSLAYQDCVGMIPGGEWINILCFNKKSFVCKKGTGCVQIFAGILENHENENCHNFSKTYPIVFKLGQ